MKLSSKISNLLASALLLSLTAPFGWTREHSSLPPTSRLGAGAIELHFSNGTTRSVGLDAVNQHLLTVGVRVSQVPIPVAAQPLLEVSPFRPLNAAESARLIELFHLDRNDLLAEIEDAGRTPAVRHGGSLQTSEIDVPPYPKVYDMKALDEESVIYLQHKFGRLHINQSDSGHGIDEVMTIVSGGPYTWFFVLEHNFVGKLRLGAIGEGGMAWRISYPGLVPHGGYFDAPHGLVVAYAHGPRHFVMRYQDSTVPGHETLGDNPWINFSAAQPVLLTHPASSNVELQSNPRLQ